MGPVQGYLAQRAELRSEQRNLQRLEAGRDSLRAQLTALNRIDVVERRARKAGLVRPGERAYIIRATPGTPADDGEPAAGEP